MSRRKRSKMKTAAPQASAPRRLLDGITRRPTLMLVLSLIVIAIAAVAVFDPKQSTGGDNGTYITLARSLINGTGFRELYTPGQPLHHQYPFGYPLLLTVVGWMTHQWLPAYNLLSLICLVAGCAFVFWALRLADSAAGGRDDWTVLAVTLLTGLNPSFLEFSHWTLTEIPYFCISFASIACFLRSHRGGRLDYRWLSGAICSAAYCYYLRPNGIVLIAALTLTLVIERRWRAAAGTALVMFLLLLPWTIFNSKTGGGLGQSVNIFFTKDVYNLDAGRLGLLGMLQRIVENWQLYFGSILPSMIVPIIPSTGWPDGLLRIIIAAGMSLLVFLGLKGLSQACAVVLLIYFCGHMALTMVWHPSVSSDRYLLPVYPLMIVGVLRELRALAARITKRYAQRLAVAGTLTLLILTVMATIPQIGAAVESLSDYARGDRLAGYDPAWRSFYEAAAWVRDHTEPQSIVVSRKPSLFYLASDRQSFCYPFTANRDTVLAALARADYVMIEPVSGTAQRYLIPVVEPLLNKKFTVVYQGGTPPTFVLQVNKENADAQTTSPKK